MTLSTPPQLGRVEPGKEEHCKQLEERLANMKTNHDLDCQNKVLPPLYPGQRMRILNRPNNTWHPRTIVQKDENPRSYVVGTTNGARLCHNRANLHAVPTPVMKKVHFVDPEPHATQTTRRPSENSVEDKTINTTNITKPIPWRDNNLHGSLQTRSGRTVRTPSKCKNL